MPAVSMKNFGSQFVPEYPVLFLFDQFIIDSQTAELVRDKNRRMYFRDMALVIDALKAAGRLEIQDFEKILTQYHQQIEASAEYDLRNIDTWVPVFKESISKWCQFADLAKTVLEEKAKNKPLSSEEYELLHVFEHGYYGHSVTIDRYFESILSLQMKMKPVLDKYDQFIIRNYFKYIGSNLCLSDILDATIYDWADIEPLYRKKLQVSFEVTDRAIEEREQVRQLFKILYSDFKPEGVRAFVNALDDSRVESLRRLVHDAVTGRVNFNEEFAVNSA